jgi:hypothetical protein
MRWLVNFFLVVLIPSIIPPSCDDFSHDKSGAPAPARSSRLAPVENPQPAVPILQGPVAAQLHLVRHFEPKLAGEALVVPVTDDGLEKKIGNAGELINAPDGSSEDSSLVPVSISDYSCSQQQ